MSTLYRVYVEDAGPLPWVKYVEAESKQHAKALVEVDPNTWGYLAAVPLPWEITHVCLCSEEPVIFTRTEPNDNTRLWECQNCRRVFVLPPDEIDWEAEQRAEAEENDFIGWWRPGLDDEFYEEPPHHPYDEEDEILELGLGD